MEIPNEIKLFYRDEIKNDRFNINGIGIREQMPECSINRPDGTGDCLLMFFYDEVNMRFKGDSISVPPGSMAYWEYSAQFYGNISAPWRHSWIHFGGTEAIEIVRRAGLSADKIIRPSGDVFERGLTALMYEKNRMEPDALILRDYFEILIRETVRSDTRYAKGPEIPRRMLEIKSHIDLNYRKHLTLDKLSKQFSISRPHLSAEFKRWFGISPGTYFIEQRLREAEVLLQDYNLQVAEVAERVGWSDVCHFTKLFKKHRGKTPTAVRSRK